MDFSSDEELLVIASIADEEEKIENFMGFYGFTT